MRTCSVEGCDKKHMAKGYCVMHYRRVTRYGMLESTYDPVIRFHQNYIPEPMSGCWLWTGFEHHNGYGGLMIKNVTVLAHRLSWQIHNGPIPKGLCVCHKCDTPFCVNPDHLFLGTNKDNIHDAIRKGRIDFSERTKKQRRNKINGRFVKKSAITNYLEREK